MPEDLLISIDASGFEIRLCFAECSERSRIRHFFEGSHNAVVFSGSQENGSWCAVASNDNLIALFSGADQFG